MIRRLLPFLLLLLLLAGCSTARTDAVLPDGVRHVSAVEDVRQLLCDGDTLWACGRDGVFALEQENPDQVTMLDAGQPLTYASALCLDDAGRLWIARDGGVTRHAEGSFLHITEEDGLPDSRVNTVRKASDGSIWVGTWSGAAVLDPDTGAVQDVVDTEDGLPVAMINVLMETPDGALWFGSYAVPDGGISILYPDGHWQHVGAEDGLVNNNVTALLQRSDGSVWVATGFYDKGGVSVFQNVGGIWTLSEAQTKADGLAGEKARSLFEDREQILWIGSEYDGLVRWTDPPAYFRQEDGLINNEVKCITYDASGRIWIGTREGITILEAGRLP